MINSASSWAQVNYQISITEPAHHVAQVRAEFEVTEAKALTLMLPAWRSGKYQILDLAKGVTAFSAVDAQGKLCSGKKLKKQLDFRACSIGQSDSAIQCLCQRAGRTHPSY